MVSVTVTKHLHEQDRWSDCARFFCRDAGQLGPHERNNLARCHAKFQAFGIFVMYEMEMFRKGKYNVGNIGLGKISSISFRINRWLEF